MSDNKPKTPNKPDVQKVKVRIPDSIAADFSEVDLADCGVAVSNGVATLQYVSTGGGMVALVRSHEARSYPGRFETEMNAHYMNDIHKTEMATPSGGRAKSDQQAESEGATEQVKSSAISEPEWHPASRRLTP